MLLSQDMDVEMFHDLEDELDAVHEGVDGDAQHAIGGGLVVNA